MDCPICYTKMNSSTFTLECGHIFHISCLNNWRKKYKSIMVFDCPYCRKKINWNKCRKNIDKIIKLIKKKLNQVGETNLADKKLKICIEIFSTLNVNLKYFTNQTNFKQIIKLKIIELSDQINDDNWFPVQNINKDLKTTFFSVTTHTNNLYKLNIENQFQ